MKINNSRRDSWIALITPDRDITIEDNSYATLGSKLLTRSVQPSEQKRLDPKIGYVNSVLYVVTPKWHLRLEKAYLTRQSERQALLCQMCGI